jgi:hypothetical protein
VSGAPVSGRGHELHMGIRLQGAGAMLTCGQAPECHHGHQAGATSLHNQVLLWLQSVTSSSCPDSRYTITVQGIDSLWSASIPALPDQPVLWLYFLPCMLCFTLHDKFMLKSRMHESSDKRTTRDQQVVTAVASHCLAAA